MRYSDRPSTSALVVPQTYGRAPSAKRIPVYASLSAEHGKITGLAWQTVKMMQSEPERDIAVG